MLSIYDKALSIAAKMLYKDRGCMGGQMCAVATTGYSKEETDRICSRCWKHYLLERAEESLHEGNDM